MIWSLIFIANMVVLGIPSALLFIPWCWITGNVLPLYKARASCSPRSCRLAGVRFQVEGLDRIPRDRACIFMSNHVSNLDPPALISLIPGRTSAFMKRSLMNCPSSAPASARASSSPWTAAATAADAQRSVAEGQRVLAKGVHITTFVEGTRSPDGRMLPFKKGPFFLAMAAGAPCIPVSIYGTETILAKGSLRIHPGRPHRLPRSHRPRRFATRDELMQRRPRRHRLRTARVDAPLGPSFPTSFFLRLEEMQARRYELIELLF
jgi:1-acyl-sn-glycerol-3-phosphate acyltransferase